MTTSRECGECNACCVWLKGDAYGHEFGGGKPCRFLEGNCSIYETRPEVCRRFQCAWLQGLLGDGMRPDRSGVLVSVEKWSGGQFLRAVEIGRKMDDEALLDIQGFCRRHGCPAIVQYDGRVFCSGPDEFLREKGAAADK